MLSVEYNYYIYDKKLLIIIKCLKNWRFEFKMICNFFEVLTDNQTLKHFKIVQKLFSKQCHYFNLISNFNFHIKYHFKKANVKVDMLIKMSDCIFDDEDERIQECYQMLLSLKQFQTATLKGGESTQQSTPGKHNFYEQIKEANQVDRELKQIKKKCVKQSERWCDTVSEKAVIQDSILYKNHYLWISESMITELLQFTHDEPSNDYQRQNWTRS